MIELVVFDMAGTTVSDGDSVNDCFRAALSGAGIVAEVAAVNAVMGLHKPVAIRRLIREYGRADTDELVRTIHDDFVRRMRSYYESDPRVREVPGAAAVFVELRAAGVKVALNSGFGRDLIDVIVGRLGWKDKVDATIASDEVPRGRPHPDMIRRLMARFDIRDAAKVAKVGDTVVDLDEGSNSGCGLIIGVTTGACTREQLEARPHTHILASVAEVPALLRGGGRP